MKSFSEQFMEDVSWIASHIDYNEIENMAQILRTMKQNGDRLFIVGIGGSSSNASHAVNDFRKICEIQAFTPFDNVAEMTARINDEGWDDSIANWLESFHFNENDYLLVLSVGGGNEEKKVSVNLINAMKYAHDKGGYILSIIGKKGYAFENSNACIYILTPNNNKITPYTESFHSVILHLLVSHPLLKENETKWESLSHS